MKNRQEWEDRGREVVEEMIEKANAYWTKKQHTSLVDHDTDTLLETDGSNIPGGLVCVCCALTQANSEPLSDPCTVNRSTLSVNGQ
jgi:hypothetical protein